ncbi:MFS transporter [Paenarthrobacter sp. NCHU4564]|uniref:MFS transporter n=1 Tax=Paenarthrobacter sp. NCHU4564 TaxID=3451353 RepID=UPI003F979391
MADPQQATREQAYTPQDTAEEAKVQRRTMLVLVIVQIIGTVGVGVAPSIGILLAGEVTDNEAWAGLARTASTLGAALLGLPLGNLAARKGRRSALATGWWTAAGGGALLVAAAQWSLIIPLFVGLLLIGAGSAVSLQARFAAADLASPHQKARALALVVWVGTLGSVLGPNLGVPGEAISQATGLTVFASAFLIAAACLGLAGTIVFVWLRPDPLVFNKDRTPTPRPVSAAKKPGRFRGVVTELRSNAESRFAVIAVLTAQVVMVSIMTMTPVHLAHHGGSVTVIGITISLHIAGMYALAPGVGFIADRYGHKVSVGIGICIFAAALATGGLKPDSTAWMMLSLILLGVGWSFVNVAGSALFSKAVSNQNRASSQGGIDALSNLLGAAAAFAAGPLLTVTSFSTLTIFATAALIPLTLLTLGSSIRGRSR